MHDNQSTQPFTKYRVPALEKGLNILEALSAATVPQTLTDLSRTLNRSTSELFRMIGLLEHRGYITREEHSGGYYLSLKLYELAHTHSSVEQLLKASSIPLRELALKTKHSCHIGILRNRELVVLAQAESPEKVRLSVEVGGRFSPVTTVSGRVLLANLSEDERQDILACSPDYQQMGDRERHEFVRALAHIEEVGYATAESETHVGILDIAVAVGNRHIGLAALALTCLPRSHQSSDDTALLVTAVRACSAQITSTLGVTPG